MAKLTKEGLVAAAGAVALWRANHYSHQPVPDAAWELDALKREEAAMRLRLEQVRGEMAALVAEVVRLSAEFPEE